MSAQTTSPASVTNLRAGRKETVWRRLMAGVGELSERTAIKLPLATAFGIVGALIGFGFVASWKIDQVRAELGAENRKLIEALDAKLDTQLQRYYVSKEQHTKDMGDLRGVLLEALMERHR